MPQRAAHPCRFDLFDKRGLHLEHPDGEVGLRLSALHVEGEQSGLLHTVLHAAVAQQFRENDRFAFGGIGL
ncbi:hypothetical protein [uncultured Parabacteroides sp.]|uniref:hypothetical protein n=1 Tax=uncultured Parabacteroides sp. TaxID=512312 RepID=UPI0026DDCADE|nr:hypothetical protein [uncultured Parabacteroides sp.]